MFCKECGTQIPDNANVCSNCGVAQRAGVNVNPVIPPVNSASNDAGGFGWGLLGFCVPIAGLILFLVWKSEKPKSSKAAGIGALVSVIASVLIYIIYFVVIVSFLSIY